MSVVIGSGVVLTDASTGVNEDNPIIGYDNQVTISNVSATSADVNHPASNLANNSTRLRWQGEHSEGDQYITVTLDGLDEVDYLAIARHNMFAGQMAVSVEGLVDDTSSPTLWTELVSDVILPNDGPAIFRFDPIVLQAIRFRIQSSPTDTAPYIAVMYVGRLLVMQRRLYVGHEPASYARQSKVTNGRSENGNFLGRVVLNEKVASSASFANLTPEFYRNQVDPFVIASKDQPFFFAWRPGSYPRECGFMWMTNDPRMNNQRSNGMVQTTFEMSGIVE